MIIQLTNIVAGAVLGAPLLEKWGAGGVVKSMREIVTQHLKTIGIRTRTWCHRTC